MPKLSLAKFECISNAVYHFLPANVRKRTKINIPPINFMKENYQYSVAL